MHSFSSPMRIARSPKLALFLCVMIAFAWRIFISSRIGLTDDEAYYWVWSRHLALSYFDHPAMVAWLIRISCSIFGETPLGVRFFAILFFVLSGVTLWSLASAMFNRRVAVVATALFAFAPIFSVGSLMMVPDAPVTFFRLFGLLIAWKIFGESKDSLRMWGLLGLTVGLGILSKYTIAIFVGSLFMFVMSEANLRARLKSRGVLVALSVAAVAMIPIFVWNIQNDWLSLRFQLIDRQVNGGGANFTRWGQFWMAQLVSIGAPLLLTCMAMWVVSLSRWSDRRWRFLFFFSFPCFALFCVQSLFATFRPHWAAPSYLVLFIAVAFWLEETLSKRRLAHALVLALFVITTLPTTLFVKLDLLTPVAAKTFVEVAGASKWNPRFDPTNDVYGWKRASREALRLRENKAQATGSSVFFAAAQYALSSQLEFRLLEPVLRVAVARDAFEFWPERVHREALIGHSAIYVTDNRFERDPRREGTFDHCQLESTLPIQRDGILAHTFYFWGCEGYRGTPSTFSPPTKVSL
jgi:hypothetical protein